MIDPTQRRPSDDEMPDDPFVNCGEHEDIVFEEQEKFEEKLNQYFDPETQIEKR